MLEHVKIFKNIRKSTEFIKIKSRKLSNALCITRDVQMSKAIVLLGNCDFTELVFSMSTPINYKRYITYSKHSIKIICAIC